MHSIGPDTGNSIVNQCIPMKYHYMSQGIVRISVDILLYHDLIGDIHCFTSKICAFNSVYCKISKMSH